MKFFFTIIFLYFTISRSCDILKELYDNLNGENWTNKKGWDIPESDCCQLYGVICTNGNITYINLTGNNLMGELPNNLWKNLEHLEYLILGINDDTEEYNKIYGDIPDEIYDLKNLIYFDLSGNKITGKISDKIGNMKNLELIAFNNMLIENVIPDSICELEKLEYLYLLNNNLEGTIPPCFDKLKNLKVLLLQNNNFKGIIEKFNENIEILDLSNNKFNNINILKHLKKALLIDISNNDFEGDAFNESHIYPKLRIINMSNNKIKNFYFPEFKELRYLNCRNNELEFVEWDEFIYNDVMFVDFSNNKITNFPNKLFQLSVSYIDFSNNEMNGIVDTRSNCYSINKDRKYFPQTIIATNNNVQVLRKELCANIYLSYLYISNTIIFDGIFNMISLAFRQLKVIDISNTELKDDINMLSKNLLQLEILNIKNTNVKIDVYSKYIFETNILNYYGDYTCIMMKTLSGSSIDADPGFMNYENCACNSYYYGKAPSCKECLKNSKCPGIIDSTIYNIYNTSGRMLPEKGFYPKNIISVSEMNNGIYPSEMNECPVKMLCEIKDFKNINEIIYCKKGNNGRFCTNCDNNYYLYSNFKCEKCPSMTIIILYFILFFIILFFIILIAYTMGGSNSGYLNILTFFIQVVSKINYSPENSVNVVNSFINYFNDFNILGINCVINWNFYNSLLFSISIPIFITILVFIIYIILFRFNKRIFEKSLRSYTFLLNFIFIPISSKIISPLICYDGYISSLPHEKCEKKYIIPSVISLILYTILFQLVTIFLSFRKSHNIKNMLIPINGCFKDDKKYWGNINILKKLLFVILFQITKINSGYQYVFLSIYFLCFMFSQINENPYNSNLENNLEILSFIFILTTYSFSIKAKDEIENNYSYKFIGSIITIINFLFIVSILLLSIKKIIQNRRKKMKNQNLMKEYIIPLKENGGIFV